MDEGGDRRRALHRIWQPDVERNLRGLPGCADEEQERREREDAESGLRLERRHRRGDPLEVQRLELREQEQRSQDERVVTDAIDDERFLAGVARRPLVEPEADEQIRAEADALPADEHDQDVRAEHEHQHERGKEVEIREVARELTVSLVVHVGGGVDVNQRTDAGDDQDHHRRERIEAERQVEDEVTRGDPRVDRLLDGARFDRHSRQLPHGHRGHDERGQHDERGHAARHGLTESAAERGVDEESNQRKERYQREHGVSIPTI